MKLNRALLSLLGLVVCLTCARAEDWKTTDGKVYHDVKVVRAEADSVTILHHDGGGRIALAMLPPDLQARFHYDPAKAKVAADERAKVDAANRQRLQVEMNRAAEQKAVTSTPPGSPTDAHSTPGNSVVIPGVDTTPVLGAAPNDATHHSIADLTGAAQAMRPDLSDPNYHTTAHMVYVIRQQGLGPDKNDPNHHTIDEAAGH